MKTSLKIGILAIVAMFSISSCSSCKNKNTNAEGVAIDTPDKTIDTANKPIDTTKTTGADTTRKDTVKK
jgi:hypothetical protein